MTKLLNSYVFPSGDYYIGDLCYTMHDEWKEICEIICQPDFDDSFAVIQLNDGRVIGWTRTAYRDGEYRDNYGLSYLVDSGSFGCILLSDISESDRKNIQLGNQVTMNEFVIDYDRGDCIFGDLVIASGDNYDCDEFEDDEFEDRNENYLIDRDGDY